MCSGGVIGIISIGCTGSGRFGIMAGADSERYFQAAITHLGRYAKRTRGDPVFLHHGRYIMVELVFFAAGKCVRVDLLPCCLCGYLSVDFAANIEQALAVGGAWID